MNLNRCGSSVQGAFTGIQYLQHFHTIFAIGTGCPAGDNTFDEVFALYLERLLSWKWYSLTFSFMRYRETVEPINTVRVDDKLPLLFYVVEYCHFLGADDNQPLLLEGMKPTYKDVRLYTALKLAGR